MSRKAKGEERAEQFRDSTGHTSACASSRPASVSPLPGKSGLNPPLSLLREMTAVIQTISFRLIIGYLSKIGM